MTLDKKIIWIIVMILLSTTVFASLDTFEGSWGTQTKSNYKGFYFVAVENITIGLIQFNESMNATNCLILNETQYSLVNRTITNSKANMNFNLTKGETYHLVVIGDINGFTNTYLNPSGYGGFPFVRESGLINYSGRNNEGLTDTLDILDGGFMNITVTQQGATASTNFDVTLIEPDDNDINVTPLNFKYNVNVNSGYDLDNCSLYLNDSGTWNINTFDVNPVNNSDNNLTLFSLVDGEYVWNIGCTDSNGNETFSTANYTIILDTVSPLIYPDKIRFNNTFTEQILSGQINLSDDNLWSINVSIDDTLIYNETNLGTTYQYNFSLNVSTNDTGIHNLSVVTCDGHTSKELINKNDYNWNNGLFNDYLKFEWSEVYQEREITIKNKNGNIFDDWSATESFDRFKFIFSPNTLSDTYTFEVESDGELSIVERPNTPYKKWLIIDNHWIDFYLEDEPNMEIDIIKTPGNKKEVEVVISNVNPKRENFIFSSVGDLNCNEEGWLFYKYNITQEYTAKEIESATSIFILNISRDSSYITNSSAVFTYNNTNISVDPYNLTDSFFYRINITTPSISDSNSSLIPFNWSYNLIGAVTKYNETKTINQNVSNLGFDDCSSYSTIAFNFSLINETDNSSLSGNMDFTFQIFKNDERINYSKTSTGVSSQAFCIFPSYVNMTTQTHIEFNSAGFDPHTYFQYNATISNVTQNIPLYLTEGTALVTFTILDEQSNRLNNAYIKILKYDIGSNSYKEIEVLKTDYNGEAIGNIILDTAWYKFIIERNGVLLRETEPTKITSTTLTITVNLLTDFYEQYNTFRGITGSFVFNNDTFNYRFVFSSTSGDVHYGCIKVKELGPLTDTLVNNTCVSGSSGTVLVNVGNISETNKTYSGVAYIKFDDEYVWDILTVGDTTGKEFYGIDGVFFTFLLVITCIMAGLFKPEASILLGLTGLTIATMLQIYTFGLLWLIGLWVLGGLLLYRISRRD